MNKEAFICIISLCTFSQKIPERKNHTAFRMVSSFRDPSQQIYLRNEAAILLNYYKWYVLSYELDEVSAT